MLTGKPYPIRAMYCQGSNMVLAYANSKMVLEAIQSLDFFAALISTTTKPIDGPMSFSRRRPGWRGIL